MSDTSLLSQIQQDLSRSPNEIVIYLEGKNDVDAFFGLLGIAKPPGGLQQGFLHQDVLVRALADNGSGSTAVKARVELASQFRLKSILGIVDGDGISLHDLAVHFDAPYSGPFFRWKSYCIENLLAKTGWPSHWSDPPQWEDVLKSYGSYVALNRIYKSLDSQLSQFRWARYSKPAFPKPVVTDAEVIAALESDKQVIEKNDLIQQFQSELLEFDLVVKRNLDEAHALVDGKWLVEHFARTRTGRSRDQCREDWIAHSISVGGLPEVRDWWERVTGSPP